MTRGPGGKRTKSGRHDGGGGSVSRRALAAATALLVLGLAACGTSSPNASKEPAPSKAADLALARKSLVVLGDMPSGWSASGQVTSGSGSNAGIPTAKIASCLGVARSEITANWPTENSPTFNNPGDTSSVTDQVETFPTTAQARTDFSTFSNPKTTGCLTSVLGPLMRKEVEQGGGPGTTIGTITATRESFPAVGDESGEIELELPITTEKVSTSLDIDLVVITVGRLETTLSFTNPLSPFNQSQAEQVAADAVRLMS